MKDATTGTTRRAKIRTTPEERFWSKVNKTETCWLWTAYKYQGYGMFRLDGKPHRAHRVAYAWEYGDIPAGLLLDHICHIPACVRPTHLRLANQKQNAENHQGAQVNSKTGIRGVSWDKRSKKWCAEVRHDGRRVLNKYFDTVAAAEYAVRTARNNHFTHNDLDRSPQ